MTRFHFLFILGLTAFIAACGGSYPLVRSEIAQRLAAPAFMVPRDVTAGPFTLLAYERMHKRGAPANIYIEDDGHAPKPEASEDPTPLNPVALHLSTRDKAENVAWLARPCQYRWKKDDGSWCEEQHWRKERFSRQVIASYNAALNDIKKRYSIDDFNLIGVGGGAAIAAILAAERFDVKTLRSVAGNLDPEAYVAYHEIAPLEGSLSPLDFAGKLSRIPQYHFIGGQDDHIPPQIYNSFAQGIASMHCVQHELIQEAEHQKGLG